MCSCARGGGVSAVPNKELLLACADATDEQLRSGKRVAVAVIDRSRDGRVSSRFEKLYTLSFVLFFFFFKGVLELGARILFASPLVLRCSLCRMHFPKERRTCIQRTEAVFLRS